jgi:tetratricopeptide (TPR) repeat protein
MGAVRDALLLSLFTLAIVLTGCSKPEDPAVLHRALGNEYGRKADWAAAAREYGLSLQANPNDRKVWELKANAHLRLGELRQAAESLAKPAEYTSDPAAKAESYRLVASIYVEHREFGEAEKAFAEALKFDPRDELSLSWLGEFASARGGARSMSDPPDPVWLTKAIAYYDRALSLNQNNLFSYVNKRIAINKYLVFEQQEKALAERLIQLERRDASKVAGARARLAEATAQIEAFEREHEKLSKKIAELLAAEKAKKNSTS